MQEISEGPNRLEVNQQGVASTLGTPPIIESDLASSDIVSTDPPKEEDISKHPTIPLTSPKRYFKVNWWSLATVALVLLLIGEHAIPLVLPLIDSYFHRATVTIFPTSKQVSFTYSYLIVTGTTDQNQISSRMISFTSPIKSGSIQTTGIGYTPAIQAHGYITFYNEAPYSQMITSGTVLTAGDGIQVVTDKSVTIEAGNGQTNGNMTVSAHTIKAGTKSNIPPLTINTFCCLTGILAKNTSSFIGGEDPKPFPMLSKSDLQGEATTLASSLEEKSRQNVQQQIKPTERLLQPIQCNLSISSDPKVGEMAKTATVSVYEACSAQVYDYSEVALLTRSAFLSDAQRENGSNFTQRGSLTITPTLFKGSHLEVSAVGMFVFHLSSIRLQTLKTQIAGKKIIEAQQELLQFQGVQGVYIQPAHQSDLTLPANPDQIQMIVSSYD